MDIYCVPCYFMRPPKRQFLFTMCLSSSKFSYKTENKPVKNKNVTTLQP